MIICFVENKIFGQNTCTALTGSVNAKDNSSWVCTGGILRPSLAQETDLLTVYIPNNSEVTVSTNLEWLANVVVQDGGTLIFDNKLNIGNSTNCGYTLIIENGGIIIDGSGNASERLIICDVTIISNQNNLKTPTVGWPTGGFSGPTGFTEEGENTTLPVELLSFTAIAVDNSAILYWSTASELNNDFFTLEKSRNGKDFEVMGHVEGNGTSHTRIDYSFTDRQPYLGLSYYRLNQTDYDGTTEVFPAISLLYSNSKNISVYPNPIDGQSARLRATGKQSNAPVIMNIYDLQGKIVLQKSFTTDSFGNLDKELVLEDALEKGTYILELSTSNSKDYVKISRE